jgi:TM2 domain-containing membrane protein YozV
MKRKKQKKSPLLAAILNFIIWGIGYIYLDKKINRGIVAFILNIFTWVFSFWYATSAGLLVFSGIFWIVLWSIWVSIYLSYDAYRTARRKK